MSEVDCEILISSVMERPVLWDKTLDIYKDRLATKNAWREVFSDLNPGFEKMEDKEKNAYGKDIIRRWGNLRDAYAKSKRKRRDSKKSGAGGKRPRQYVFDNQLKFLEKLYTSRETVDNLNDPQAELPENKYMVQPEEEEVGEPLMTANAAERTPTFKPQSRKRHKFDDVELKTMQALEPQTPNSKMSFFHSILPHLEKFDDSDMLQFQMEVLQVIAKINDKKK